MTQCYAPLVKATASPEACLLVLFLAFPSFLRHVYVLMITMGVCGRLVGLLVGWLSVCMYERAWVCCFPFLYIFFLRVRGFLA